MDLSHGKYLGVDYGDKRTGLAECDVSGMLSSAIATIEEGGMLYFTAPSGEVTLTPAK